MRRRSDALLLLDTLIEARDVDDDAFVRAIADRLLLVVSLDLEYERAAIDSDQLRRRADAHSDRRGGEMADIEMDAETLMTVREEVLDCRQCRGLDHIDHDRSGKYGHSSAADARGGVFHANQQICRSHHPGFQMRQVEHVQSPGWDLSRVVVAGMSHCPRQGMGVQPDVFDGVNRAR